MSLGNNYRLLSQYDKAIGLYQKTLPIYQQIKDHNGEALALKRLGNVYDSLSQYDKAIGYYQQALTIYQQVKDHSGEAKILMNLGMAYGAVSQYEKAIAYYQQALTIYPQVKDRTGESLALISLGNTYRSLSQYEKAIGYYQQALPMFQQVKDINGEAVALVGLGNTYQSLSQHEKAIGYYQQALPMFQQVKDRDGEASTLMNLGTAYGSLSQYEKAIAHYQQALPIRQQVKDRDAEAMILGSLGNTYISLLQYEKAIGYYQQALLMFQQVKDRDGEAVTLMNLGVAHKSLSQYEKAIGYYQQALPISQQIKDRKGEATTLYNFAAAYHAQNKLTDALQNINAAIPIVESLRSELKNDANKTSYFASVQGYYQLKTDLLMQLHQQQPNKGYDAQALETTDQSRARVLRELLIQANANINKDIDPALLKQEQTLNQTIDAKETQLVQLSSQPNKAAQLPALNQEIAALYAQRDDLKNTIRATNPAYANLQYPKPITLAQIQQQLDPDTLMLQYSLGEKESYLWVISQTTLKTYILPKRTDIEKTIATFRKELTAQLPAPNSATQLTQQILGPAAGDLGNKRLVIIPDGILHTIPFAALNTPNSTTYNPLLTQHEITNLPSASTIGILRTTVATKPRGTKTLAILADPIFRKDDPRLTSKTIQTNNNLDIGEQSARGRIGRDLDLDRLPFTATEAKGILALVPNQDSTSAFGFDASYDWITNPKISQYRYVHLATHGFFDNDKPALSSIILSSFDEKGNDRKAFLRFPDLFNLNLPTELVVLSACETGLGNNVPGEGLVGMTRGLMYAGAMRVAVSLWAVDDQATSDLMQDFYKNLWQSKKSHAASLRAAQLKLHQQGKAPYYWAAFTLQGEWRD
jgi:CHAT domain-containing protein/uncharacterized protein HemY